MAHHCKPVRKNTQKQYPPKSMQPKHEFSPLIIKELYAIFRIRIYPISFTRVKRKCYVAVYSRYLLITLQLPFQYNLLSEIEELILNLHLYE